MGFLSRLLSKLLGLNLQQSPPSVSTTFNTGFDRATTELIANARKLRASIEPATDIGISINVSYTGPVGSDIHISEAEISEAIAPYEFVITNQVEPLKAPERWFEESAQKRRLHEDSEKAYAWVTPFVPLPIASSERVKVCLEQGPRSATSLSKSLRALVRERRKSKENCHDILRALYGSCILSDLSNSLSFDGRFVHSHVDIKDIQQMVVDYQAIGYQRIDALTKTDVKWLIEAFGEPSKHLSVEDVWSGIRRNAISRYSWEELRRSNKSARYLNLPEQTMDEWLRERLGRSLGYRKEWEQRNANRRVELGLQAAKTQAACAATQQSFVVADLETTGLDAQNAEIIEFAAVVVNPDGSVVSEFSMLVRPRNRIPAEITQITGITQQEVDGHGQPLAVALAAFLSHIGNRPVFFHNAPFDVAFIAAAASNTLTFKNPVHDTLPLARRAWPSLGTYSLGALAEHIGAKAPRHRALGDALAALAVLLAARARLM